VTQRPFGRVVGRLDPSHPEERPQVVTSKGVEPITHAERASNLDFEATGAGATDVIPGWKTGDFHSGSFSRRFVERGAHGGRAFLEITSAPEARSSQFGIVQDLAAGPYRGKRVRFRAYLKTKGLADPADLWLRSDSDTGMRFVSTMGRGPKGTTDWGPQEVVLDMSADAGGLSFWVVAPGAGTLGIDDASLEVVDPAPGATTPTRKEARRCVGRSDRLAQALDVGKGGRGRERPCGRPPAQGELLRDAGIGDITRRPYPASWRMEIDRMQLEVGEYLSSLPTETAGTA
jgi:hypothetical protein